MAQISGHKLTTSDATGATSEAIALARLIELGYNVSIPFNGKLRYDLVVDDGRELLRAQVKTGRLVGSTIKFESSTVRGGGARRSYVGDADVFLVYCPDMRAVFWVPVGVTGESRSTMLRVHDSKSANARMDVPKASVYLFTEPAHARRARLEEAERKARAKSCSACLSAAGPQVHLVGGDRADAAGLFAVPPAR